MGAVTEKLSQQRFREIYAQEKPYFELLNGEAVQKVFDPVSREGWYWRAGTGDLTHIRESYRFRAGP